MEQRSILAAYAHPDDEAFGSGGTLAKYAQSGAQVTLVCATRGEVGEISDPALATPENLGQVREQEMLNAAQALGVSDVRFLDYRDSGMAGTDDNHNPAAFVNVPAEEVVERLVRIIREVRPQVVVTFDPNGGYGHPDHIAIHQHTVAAFHLAGDPERYPEAGPVWQPARLFYNAIPRSTFLAMRDRLVAAGEDTSMFDRIEENGMGWPDDQIQAQLDVSGTVGAKWQSLMAHRTQFGENNMFRRFPEDEVQRMMSQEHFVLAWPQPTEGFKLSDLFEGVA
ncbi:MAG: PIG-L family deacetylase [Chloroflexi bacterium]|nr:PIG-L family deacetylase [Chloroflexota bacterium]